MSESMSKAVAPSQLPVLCGGVDGVANADRPCVHHACSLDVCKLGVFAIQERIALLLDRACRQIHPHVRTRMAAHVWLHPSVPPILPIRSILSVPIAPFAPFATSVLSVPFVPSAHLTLRNPLARLEDRIDGVHSLPPLTKSHATEPHAKTPHPRITRRTV